MVALDYETSSKLRKDLPNSRRFTNSAGDETINLHTIGISRQPPSQPPVTQPEDRRAAAMRRQTRRVHDSPPAFTPNNLPQRLTVRLAVQALRHQLPATLHLRNNSHIINVFIDTECLQTNISANTAKLLAKNGSQIFGRNIVLTAVW